MRNGEFLGIIRELARLNPAQRKELLERLASGFDTGSSSLVGILKKPTSCPGCDGHDWGSWGTRKGIPRFRCKGCGSVFTALSGSPLARLYYRDKWLQYAGCLLDGLSIRRAAKECGLSNPTSFRWRHRFLAMIDTLKPPELKGVVEIDETLFLDSKKGDRHLSRSPRKRGSKAAKPGRSNEQVTVVVARDRHGITTDFVLKQFNADAVTAELLHVISPDSLLCTDGSTVLTASASRNGLLHFAINASAGDRVLFNIFHVQNVNAYHGRLKDWMARFRGVSTKWLARYLGWWRMLDGNQDVLSPDQVLRYAIA